MSQPQICPSCGNPSEPYVGRLDVKVGRWSHQVEVEGHRCGKCGQELFDPELVQQALVQAARIVREVNGLVSPEQIKALRARHSLTQSALERMLDLGPKTIVRWERGTVAPNKMASKLIALLIDRPDLVSDFAIKAGIQLGATATFGAWLNAPPSYRGVNLKEAQIFSASGGDSPEEQQEAA